jgi:hypothetical protein
MFGNHLNLRGDNVPGLGSIKELSLREALVRSQEALKKPSPRKPKVPQNVLYKPNKTMLQLKTDDLKKALKGRDEKKRFIRENEQQIR